MRHACWAECRRPHSQCFVLEGGPLEQADGRAGGTGTVFGIDTEQQVLQSQAEHSTGDSLGSQCYCFQGGASWGTVTEVGPPEV